MALLHDCSFFDFPEPVVEAVEGLGAAHQLMMVRAPPTGFQPYKKPTMIELKVKKDVRLCMLIFSN